MRLIGTNEELKKNMFKMELLVHDEIIGEAPFVKMAKCVPVFKQCMLGSAKDVRSGAKCDEEVSLVWYGDSYELEDLNIETLNKIKKEVYK